MGGLRCGLQGHPTEGEGGLARTATSIREVSGDSTEVGRQAHCIIAQPGPNKSPAGVGGGASLGLMLAQGLAERTASPPPQRPAAPLVAHRAGETPARKSPAKAGLKFASMSRLAGHLCLTTRLCSAEFHREGDQQARPINGAAGGWFHSARPQKKPRQSAAGRSDDVHRGWACRSSPRAFLL